MRLREDKEINDFTGYLNNSDVTANSVGGHHYGGAEKQKAVEEIKGRFRTNGYKGMLGDDYYKGAGVNVDSSWSVDKKLKESGLDWSTDTSILQYGNKMQFTNINQQAVYRSDNGLLFGVTNETWQPYQNKEVISAFDDFCNTAGIELERIGSLREGRIIFASAICNDSWEIMGTDDVIAGRILLMNSHEYGKGLTIKLNAIRLVCSNGVTTKVGIGQKTIGHNQSFRKSLIHEILASTKVSFADLGDRLDKLTKIEISNQDAKDFLVNTLGDNEEGTDRPKSFYEQNRLVRNAYYSFANHTSDGAHFDVSHQNAWELFNCVTQEVNHNMRSSGETHLHSLWNGYKANIQSKVLSSLEYEFNKRNNKVRGHQNVQARAF